MGKPKRFPHQLPNTLVGEEIMSLIEAEYGRRTAAWRADHPGVEPSPLAVPRSDVVRDMLAAGALVLARRAAGRQLDVLGDARLDELLTSAKSQEKTQPVEPVPAFAEPTADLPEVRR